MVLLDMLEQQQEEEDTDKVNLLTLHAAKGLEFPFVYMMGLEEELLPHKNSIAAETVEEERRLMYVGITRARQGLTLTLAEQRKAGGQMKQMTPSRFLDELPQDELDWLGRKKKRNRCMLTRKNRLRFIWKIYVPCSSISTNVLIV
jgi:ATP-dependent DNA helicase Rep